MTRIGSSQNLNNSKGRYPLRVKRRTSEEPDSADCQLKPSESKNLSRTKRNKQNVQDICPCGRRYGGKGGFDGTLTECRNKGCGQWWHPSCAELRIIPSEDEVWHCSKCRSAEIADAAQDPESRWNDRPKRSPERGLGERDDENLLRDSFYFDDLFMSRTEYLQLDDRSIEGRMSQIDDLIVQVAASYAAKELNVLQDPDFKKIETEYPELATIARTAFGLGADTPLAMDLLPLEINESGIMNIVRSIIAVSVQKWVFLSWFPEYLSPDGPVQTILKAGYKMAQKRGETRFQKAQQRFWQDVLVGICGTQEFREEMRSEASKFGAKMAELLSSLKEARLQNDGLLSESINQKSAKSAEWIKKLERLFIESLDLKLDLALKDEETWFFWPLPNEIYDGGRMIVDDQIVFNEEVFKGRKVRLGLLPGVGGFKKNEEGRERCILAKARVIL